MKQTDRPHGIIVPERVRLRAEQSGPQTRQWLKDLPGLLAELEKESGLDEASIWEWGFIERVSTGLYLCAYASRKHGQPFFKTAQLLLDT